MTQPDRQATIRRAVMAVFEADLPRGDRGRRSGTKASLKDEPNRAAPASGEA